MTAHIRGFQLNATFTKLPKDFRKNNIFPYSVSLFFKDSHDSFKDCIKSWISLDVDGFYGAICCILYSQ